MWCWTTTTPTSATTSTACSPRTRGSPCNFTPTSGSWLNLVEVLFGIITRASDPPRILRQRQATRRRDPHLHRRLERTLPPLRLDQDRRRHPAPRHPATSDARDTRRDGPERGGKGHGRGRRWRPTIRAVLLPRAQGPTSRERPRPLTSLRGRRLRTCSGAAAPGARLMSHNAREPATPRIRT